MKKVEYNNPRFPHTIKVFREGTNPDDPFAESGEPIILYEGEGRSFAKAMTDGSGKIITNSRQSSIPKTYWSTPIIAGDLIEIRNGNIVEKGEVIDCNVGNFYTLIFWKYGRN